MAIGRVPLVAYALGFRICAHSARPLRSMFLRSMSRFSRIWYGIAGGSGAQFAWLVSALRSNGGSSDCALCGGAQRLGVSGPFWLSLTSSGSAIIGVWYRVDALTSSLLRVPSACSSFQVLPPQVLAALWCGGFWSAPRVSRRLRVSRGLGSCLCQFSSGPTLVLRGP